jgi:hypothetical protein
MSAGGGSGDNPEVKIKIVVDNSQVAPALAETGQQVEQATGRMSRNQIRMARRQAEAERPGTVQYTREQNLKRRSAELRQEQYAKDAPRREQEKTKARRLEESLVRKEERAKKSSIRRVANEERLGRLRDVHTEKQKALLVKRGNSLATAVAESGWTTQSRVKFARLRHQMIETYPSLAKALGSGKLTTKDQKLLESMGVSPETFLASGSPGGTPSKGGKKWHQDPAYLATGRLSSGATPGPRPINPNEVRASKSGKLTESARLAEEDRKRRHSMGLYLPGEEPAPKTDVSGVASRGVNVHGFMRDTRRAQRLEKLEKLATDRKYAEEVASARGGTAEQWQKQARSAQKSGMVGKEGDIKRSPLEMIMQYIQWRMLRFASLLVVYYGIMKMAQAWYKVGFMIDAANDKSQRLNKTWYDLKQGIITLAQSTANSALVGSVLTPAKNAVQTMNAADKAWADADAKYPKDNRYWDTLKGAIDPALSRRGRYADERYNYYKKHPDELRPKQDPEEQAKARMGWAETQLKSTPRGEKTLAALASSIKELDAWIARRPAAAGTVEFYQREQARLELVTRRQQVRALQGGGQKAETYGRMATHYEGMIESSFPGIATVDAYRKRRQALQDEVRWLEKARDTQVKYTDTWMEYDQKLNEARRALLPNEREIRRMAFGLGMDKLALAGVGNGLVSGMTGWSNEGFPVMGARASRGQRTRSEFRFEMGNMTEEQKNQVMRDLGLKMLRENGRNYGRDWATGVGGQ